MNSNKKHLAAPIVGLAIALAALTATLFHVNNNAQAALTSSDINYSLLPLGQTNGLGISITGSTATNLNTDIDISKSGDVAIMISGNPDSTDTSVITAVLAPSLDGTTNTMETLKTVTLAFPMVTAGVPVVIHTNWSSSAYSGYSGMGGYRHLMLRYITNAAGGSVKFTNVFVAVPYKRGKLTGNP